MPIANHVLFLSARQQGVLIRQKKLSPVELTDANLARIDALNARTNAFITVTADVARRQAAEACGFSSGPPALPIGLQLYSRGFDEPALFRVGHAYEQATEWHRRRPPVE